MKKVMFTDCGRRGYTPPVTEQVIIYQTDPLCLSPTEQTGNMQDYLEEEIDDDEWYNN